MRYERWWHRAAPGSEFLDAIAVLKVLFDARKDNAAVNVLRIRELTHLGFEESESLLQRMHDAGWVGRIRAQRTPGLQWRRSTQARQERWALLVNPEKLALADVFRVFAFTPAPGLNLSDRVAQFVNRDLSTSIAAYFSAPDANANSASST